MRAGRRFEVRRGEGGKRAPITADCITRRHRRVMAAGEAKAREIGSASNIAVVDAGGNLVGHIRMDGAWIGSIDISINKHSLPECSIFRPRTLLKWRSRGGVLRYPCVEPRVIIFAGGMPLRRGDRIVGAVGVSGGTGEQDQPWRMPPLPLCGPSAR